MNRLKTPMSKKFQLPIIFFHGFISSVPVVGFTWVQINFTFLKSRYLPTKSKTETAIALQHLAICPSNEEFLDFQKYWPQALYFCGETVEGLGSSCVRRGLSLYY